MTKAWKLVGKAMSTVQSLGNNLHSLTGWQVVAGNQEVQLIANSTEKLSIALVALPLQPVVVGKKPSSKLASLHLPSKIWATVAIY